MWQWISGNIPLPLGNGLVRYLSAENKQMLWVPIGFAHGIYVTSPQAEVLYKATDYYAPQWERTILWNDPVINIQWPTKGELPILSPKMKLASCCQKQSYLNNVENENRPLW